MSFSPSLEHWQDWTQWASHLVACTALLRDAGGGGDGECEEEDGDVETQFLWC